MPRKAAFYRTAEGIDYTHPAFINADGSSRIISIWDQSIPYREEENVFGRKPLEFDYGTEYTNAEIGEALQSDNPWSVVPSRDENGHGTFLAGVACGNENEEKGFSGIAPLAGIVVVKCKQAKQNLKDYYRITTDEPCYMENDIMLGIRYLVRAAYYNRMPVVVCLAMGTNQGSHNRGGALGMAMRWMGTTRGVAMVAAGGNEANASHHYHENALAGKGETEVELRVAEGETGFSLELWCSAPALCSIALISPSGEYSGKTYARLGEKEQVIFRLDNTVVDIDYFLTSFESGDECISVRFLRPVGGIWRLRVFNETDLPTDFDIWLPMRGFVREGTYFLRADPDITLCEPSNNQNIITSTYYDGAGRGVVVDSSRGYNRKGDIRPDIASVGKDIYGPLPMLGNYYSQDEEERQREARYGIRTGSSEGAAVAAGASVLLMEWGLMRGNEMSMNTLTIQKYLIRGANRTGRNFPNREWGYGTLDLYGALEWFRTTL